METSHCAQCGLTFVDKNLHGDFSRRFGWPEGKPLLVPACQCHAAKSAAVEVKEAEAEMEARVQATFTRMGFGKAKLPDNLPAIPGEWRYPVDAVKSGHNLILTGAVGTGKTTLLKSIVKTLVQNHVPVRGGYVPQLMASLKQMDDLSEIMASIEYGKVLVLDDLDKMLGTVYEIEKLSSMVNLCLQEEKPVLVTTNLSFVQLKRLLCSNKYGVPENWVDSFLSRLQHNAQIVNFHGSDFRRAKDSFVMEV